MRLYWVKFIKVGVILMQLEKTRKIEKMEAYDYSKPVCYFCSAQIKSGDEIVLRNDEKLYHRKCYEHLFTLKSSSIIPNKRNL